MLQCRSKYMLVLSSPLSLFSILPSLDQTFLKPNFSLASFSFATRGAVKISVTDTLAPFSNFLFT